MTLKIGDTVGLWSIVGEADPYVLASGKKRRRVLARCSCGTEAVVHVANLRDGKSKSCGCVRQERSVTASTTHGMSGSGIYQVWCSMVQRTTNPNYPKWCDYGGRGIGVCDEWRSFEKFYADMGDKPSGMTLERVDNSKGYCAANCRWASVSEQGNNRRSTVFLEYNGERKALTVWARERGMKRHTLANRLRLGWSVKRALETTVN